MAAAGDGVAEGRLPRWRRHPFRLTWLLLPLLFCLSGSPALADFEAGLRAYQAGDHRSAYQQWMQLAEAGDPAAMRNVGHLYRWGHGVAQDPATAAEWYRRAADLGLDRAQANLGMMYLEGQGVEQDGGQAAYWLSQAAIQGHTVAQYNLAQLYLDGRGVQRNEALALGWLQRAARAGHPGALDQLAQLVAQAPPPAPELQRLDSPPEALSGSAPPDAPGDQPPQPPAAAPPVPAETSEAQAAQVQVPLAESPRAESPQAASRLADAGGESLEVQEEGEKPAILDRLAGIFSSGAPAARTEPAPRPADDSRGEIPDAPRPATESRGSDGASDARGSGRSDAESWVLGLIENVITAEKAGEKPDLPVMPPPVDEATAPPRQPAPAEPGTPAPQPPAPTVQATPPAATAASGEAGRPSRPPAAPPDLPPPAQAEAQADEALRLYQQGRYAEARALWDPVAHAGIGRAQYMLGWMHESGQGGVSDPILAFYWYSRASRSGDQYGHRALNDLRTRMDPATLSRAEAFLDLE